MLSKRKGIISVLAVTTIVSTSTFSSFATNLEKTDQSISVILDGNKVDLGKDSQGNTIHPFKSNGRVYVPVRALVELINKPIGWDEKTQTVYVGEKTTNNHLYLNTKSPYPYEKVKYTNAPEGYKPVFINYVGRHGSRHLSSSKYDKTLMELLTIAENDRQITDLGKKLKSEISKLMEIEKDKYGLLSISGKQELKDIGARLGTNYKEIFDKDKKNIAVATFKDRTPESRDSFIKGLRESLSGTDLNIEVSSYEEGKDPYLRPYDISPKYAEYEEDGEWKEIHEKYISKDIGNKYDKEILLKLFSESFYNRLDKGEFELKDEKGKVNLKNPSDAASNLYELYIISSNLKGEGNFSFDSYFTEDQLKWYESIDNIEDFYEKGPSLTSNDLTQNIIAPLVKDLIVSTDESIKNKDTSGVFRFAHAETIIPLSSFLDIKGANVSTDNAEEVSKVWDGSTISPMGANIQWVIYSNGSDYLVKMLRNEKEIAFPIETDTYPYYKWEDVKSYYKNKIEKIGFDLNNSLEEDIKILNDNF